MQAFDAAGESPKKSRRGGWPHCGANSVDRLRLIVAVVAGVFGVISTFGIGDVSVVDFLGLSRFGFGLGCGEFFRCGLNHA